MLNVVRHAIKATSLQKRSIKIRRITPDDIPTVAFLRSNSEDKAKFWIQRISDYLAGLHNPQKALATRVIFVAEDEFQIVGFIAGQLTTRFECEGELQWLDVSKRFRRQGIASALVVTLARWFEENCAHKVCVDPGNDSARQFYSAHGAEELNDHWLYWSDIRSLLKN